MVSPSFALPRVVIAAAASGSGKTTIATGLMAALRASGRRVAGFKIGPDFIDPGYHSLATGRPGRNLDPVLCTEELIVPLLLHGGGFAAPAEHAEPGLARPATVGDQGRAAGQPPADIAIVEGVMGLFDGQLATAGFGSTAHVARLIDAPVVLVVDATASSRTAAAVAVGLRSFDRRIRIASVVVNQVSGPRHAAELAAVFADAGMPVLGFVPRSATIAAPSRHLGLVPADERAESAGVIEALAAHVAEHVDIEALYALAAQAPPVSATPWSPVEVMRRVDGRPVVGVLAGRAFTFRYAETTELLQAAGCRVVEIDPLVDAELPAGLAGVYIGGGFPEMHAAELSHNAALRAAIQAAVADGLPTVAECAGQLYLGQHLDGHPMVAALPATARMTPRLTLGYRTASVAQETLLAPPAAEVRGHEFHRTQTTPNSGAAPAWQWNDAAHGFSLDPAGLGRPTLHASYLHVHWAGFPDCAQRFADACAAHARDRALLEPDDDHARGNVRLDSGKTSAAEAPADVGSSAGAPTVIGDGIDLRHHGDAELRPGLIDLAVNVMTPGPPPWLAAQITATIADLGAYPDPTAARRAVAARHGVDPEMVLLTAGAAEAFTLIARTLTARNPMVVHPQFTEPEAALRAAGHAVQRWLLPVDGAEVPPLGELPAWADAVFVGNPTNPTGWLHPADRLRAANSGRLLVVDEAFMDATDEAETMIEPQMPGRLVVRSLSKTWGLAGLRVGAVIGDPEWIARLADAQPCWPLSSPALAAIIATSTGAARAEADALYRRLAADRDHLVAALAAAGFSTLPSRAPFVLIDTSVCGPGSVRPALADRGFAVRRGESFPGLAPTWIRVKVPAPAVADRLVAELTLLRG